MTSITSERLSQHLEINNIRKEEHKGCKKYSQRHKEQTTINAVMLQQVKTHQRNIGQNGVCWTVEPLGHFYL
jgi:hypothetical protein